MENGLKLTLGVPVDQVPIAAAVGLIGSPLFKELDIKTFQLNINACPRTFIPKVQMQKRLSDFALLHIQLPATWF